jgi:hypothetical protein
VNRAMIDVHIEELVLHGFEASKRYEIADALTRELARALAGDRLPRLLRADGRIESLDGGSFRMAAGAKPKRTGAKMAEQVYEGLNR